MEEVYLKRRGIIVLIYSILGAGGVNFWMWSYVLVGACWDFPFFVVAIPFLTITFICGFLCSLIGSIGLILDKKWGGKISSLGVLASLIFIFLCDILFSIFFIVIKREHSREDNILFLFLIIFFNVHLLLSGFLYLKITVVNYKDLVIKGIMKIRRRD